MNIRIDRDRVISMRYNGLTQSEIAKRMECSERQIRRIISECKMNNVECKMNKRTTMEDEHLCWRVAFNIDKSYSAIAKRFGVSRQAVQNQLSIVNDQF